MQLFFYVRREMRYEQIRFADVLYIKAKRGYMQVVTEQRTFLVLNTLSELMKILPAELFCRIHHSYIVSIERVKEFDRTYVKLHEAPPDKPYKQGLARISELPMGFAYRSNFLKSVVILKNKTGSHTKTKRKAEFELEGEELELSEVECG